VVVVVDAKPQFAPGEQVKWINEYGVDLGSRTIASAETISYSENGIGYIIIPHDAPWFAVPESQLHPCADEHNDITEG
jgi:hypothetical protein